MELSGFAFFEEYAQDSSTRRKHTHCAVRTKGPTISELTAALCAEPAREFARIVWGNPQSYDPGWVYHGLLLGTPADAAYFLQKLISGAVLSPPLLEQMLIRHPLNGPIPNRPWQTTGYGLGLMIGELKDAGMAIGHSGGGPGSVSAVYHFADRPVPVTISAFAKSDAAGVVEFEVERLARRLHDSVTPERS